MTSPSSSLPLETNCMTIPLLPPSGWRTIHRVGIFSACWLLIVLAVCRTTPAQAQDPARTAADSVRVLDLPEEVADEVIEAFNDPERIRILGSATISAGDTIVGSVAALEGPLELAGHVTGDVLIVNGDLRLLPGASIGGSARVVGGVLEGYESAQIGGEMVVYPDRLRYRREDGRLVRIAPDLPGVGVTGSLGWGRSDFLVASGDSYNRVEGLPITFGPRVSTAGSNPLRVHALAIYRTETGFRFDTDDFGYYVQAEQFLGGRRHFRIGASAHSVVQPIEDWQLSDLESGLSTFFLRRDYRDHFERTGVSLFATWDSEREPYALTAEIRRERHRSLPAGSPLSLFRNAQEWRPQPLVGEGQVTQLRLSGRLDTRSDPDEPATGWFLRGHIDQGISSHLTLPDTQPAETLDPQEPDVLISPAIDYGLFTRGLLDIRRYNRVDPRSRLNFRLLLGGSLTGDPLPPQYQHALGGEGSLPGYDLFSLDCQARRGNVVRAGLVDEAADPAVYFPRYGCDAFALLQAEYRGRFTFRMRWDSAPWADEGESEIGYDADRAWEFAPDWTLFVDAGRGWTWSNAANESLAVDVGVGLVLGRFGAFLALPLTGDGGINAFVRLGPRF